MNSKKILMHNLSTNACFKPHDWMREIADKPLGVLFVEAGFRLEVKSCFVYSVSKRVRESGLVVGHS